MRWGLASLPILVFLCCPQLPAAELAVLSKQNWKEFAVKGKEADCIYGDYVLRNDLITAVIAAPKSTRNANMTVRNVGWTIIDLTTRSKQNDQLSAYYPGSLRHAFTGETITVHVDGGAEQTYDGRPLSGAAIAITCAADEVAGRPAIRVRYSLRDGDPFVLVETIYENKTNKEYVEDRSDTMRADGTFQFGSDPATHSFWANDEWFRQTYGIAAADYLVEHEGDRGVVIHYGQADSRQLKVASGESHTFARQLFPAANLLQSRGIAAQLAGRPVQLTTLQIVDPRGPVKRARLEVTAAAVSIGSGRTDNKGRITFAAEPGQYQLTIDALGRPQKVIPQLALPADQLPAIMLEPCGYVVGRLTNQQGQPTPCLVQFQGLEGTPDPDFGPTTAVTVRNLHYSHDGSFRQEIAPGKYHVIVSYGPEHNALFRDIEVRAGEDTVLDGKLERVVDTAGWVSADFHSHSSPSGDNTCSQRARVLNLLCENVEFCPCTEHNRIDSYVPHLKKLKVEHLMATCSGMELTGQPLPINHQNAFPLKRYPHTQDNGAPRTDENPIVQIERLAMWDQGSDKLVQINHPNLVQMIGDRDENGEADGGFAKMFDYMDVIEVHPLQTLLVQPGTEQFKALRRNPIFHWLQMLNLGYRVTGVVNTDAHYSLHESGGLRNFIRSSTDDPASIDTMEMVRNATAGQVVLTNGPFLTVEASGGGKKVGPGEDLKSGGQDVELTIRVQCPNWLDVNRVQIFVNGRCDPQLNFTRQANSAMFGDQVVKFAHTIPIKLQRDTHLVVCAANEGVPIGPVMGPNWGTQFPIAVSNPIYVDVDGDDFQACGDLLEVPLPLERTELPQR